MIQRSVKIIGAITLDRVIGVYPTKGKNAKGRLPWNPDEAKGDLELFQQTTKDGAVIMGRKTWESLPSKPLEDRLNFVVSGGKKVHDAVSLARVGLGEENLDRPIWLIGGNGVFQEGVDIKPGVEADEIVLTVVPILACKRYKGRRLVYFPAVNEKVWGKPLVSRHPINSSLRTIRYRR